MNKYKIVREKGKKYIVDENGNIISKGWDNIWEGGLVKGQSNYYTARRDDEKVAIFHKDNPNKPISKWWKEIWFDDLIIKGESDYYLVQRNDNRWAIFYKDYKDIPLTEWSNNINIGKFIEKHKNIPLNDIISGGIKRYIKELC